MPAASHRAHVGKTGSMLLTIERVAIMKSVDIFAATPDHILASVARIVEEVEVAAGESLLGSDGEIVEQGEMIEWQGDAVNWTLSFVDDRVAETATRTLISKSDGDGTRYEMLNDSTTFPIGTSLAQVIAELGQPTSREEDLRIVWRFTDCSRIEARYVGGRGRDMSMR